VGDDLEVGVSLDAFSSIVGAAFMGVAVGGMGVGCLLLSHAASKNKPAATMMLT
jgi:hypothetical protein